MRATKNLSIEAVRKAQKSEYIERRKAASCFGPDTLFGWKQPDKPEQRKTGK